MEEHANLLIFCALIAIICYIVYRVVTTPVATTTTTSAAPVASEQLAITEAIDKIKDTIPDAITNRKSAVRRVRSHLDNQLYAVAVDQPDPRHAADLFSEMNSRTADLIFHLKRRLDTHETIKADDGVDLTPNIRRLIKRHYKQKINFAEYHNPFDTTVGSNSRKGAVVEICLRSKRQPSQWNSKNTLFRVVLHELSHSADSEVRGEGEAAHGPDFQRIHGYLLSQAESLGLYSCAEYDKSGHAFCGLTLTEDYCV